MVFAGTVRRMHSFAAASLAAPSSFRVSPSHAVLAQATRPGIDIAVWTRAMPAFVGAALARWAPCAPAPVDRMVRLSDAGAEEVEGALAALPAGPEGWLRDDVASLLARFAALSRVAEARVFFGVIRDDQCTKFHVDAVSLRLVTTYLGPGTEWVPDEAVDRRALGRMIRCPAEANAAIVPVTSAVRRAKAGHVLVLKGSRHESAAGGGAVHRSPPIASRGALRVALVVTAAGGPSP